MTIYTISNQTEWETISSITLVSGDKVYLLEDIGSKTNPITWSGIAYNAYTSRLYYRFDIPSGVIFDGCFNTVYIDNSSYNDFRGIFKLTGGTIKGLCLDFVGAPASTKSLLIDDNGYGTIEDCHIVNETTWTNTGGVTTPQESGGFISRLGGSVSFTRCSYFQTDHQTAKGLCGFILRDLTTSSSHTVSFTDCFSYTNPNSNNGGFIGENFDSECSYTFTRCYGIINFGSTLVANYAPCFIGGGFCVGAVPAISVEFNSCYGMVIPNINTSTYQSGFIGGGPSSTMSLSITDLQGDVSITFNQCYSYVYYGGDFIGNSSFLQNATGGITKNFTITFNDCYSASTTTSGFILKLTPGIGSDRSAGTQLIQFNRCYGLNKAVTLSNFFNTSVTIGDNNYIPIEINDCYTNNSEYFNSTTLSQSDINIITTISGGALSLDALRSDTLPDNWSESVWFSRLSGANTDTGHVVSHLPYLRTFSDENWYNLCAGYLEMPLLKNIMDLDNQYGYNMLHSYPSFKRIGTEYYISTLTEFIGKTSETFYPGDKIFLYGDIGDAGTFKDFQGYKLIIPAGVTFYGRGFTIYVDNNNNGQYGIIELKGGTIRDVSIKCNSFPTGGGGVLCRGDSYGYFKNVHIWYDKNDTNTSNHLSAGFIAYAGGDCIFENCMCYHFSPNASRGIAGFIGGVNQNIDATLTFKECVYNGNLTDDGGGFIGNGDDTYNVGSNKIIISFLKCYSLIEHSSSVMPTGCGGFIGSNLGGYSGSSNTTIHVKFHTCFVYQTEQTTSLNALAGGFIGKNCMNLYSAVAPCSLTFQSCFSKIYTTSTEVGDFIGTCLIDASTYSPTSDYFLDLIFDNCYSMSDYSGGFISKVNIDQPSGWTSGDAETRIILNQCYSAKPANMKRSFVGDIHSNNNVYNGYFKILINNCHTNGTQFYNYSSTSNISSTTLENSSLITETNSATNDAALVDNSYPNGWSDTYWISNDAKYPLLRYFYEEDDWVNTVLEYNNIPHLSKIANKINLEGYSSYIDIPEFITTGVSYYLNSVKAIRLFIEDNDGGWALHTNDTIILSDNIGSVSTYESYTIGKRIVIPTNITFNGNRHIMYLNTGIDFRGLFDLRGGTIQELGVYIDSNSENWTSTDNQTGETSGYLVDSYPYGTITKCALYYYSVNQYSGALCGSHGGLYGDLTVSKCYIEDISEPLRYYSGSIFGSNTLPYGSSGNTITVEDCSLKQTETSIGGGGFIGCYSLYEGTINFNRCAIHTEHVSNGSGGFLGMYCCFTTSDLYVNFNDCYVSKLNGTGYINEDSGGFLGYHNMRDADTSDETTDNTVQMTFTKCWCNLNISGTGAGGFIGQHIGYSQESTNYSITFTDCYWIGSNTISNNTTSGGFIARLEIPTYLSSTFNKYIVTLTRCYAHNININENKYLPAVVGVQNHSITNKIIKFIDVYYKYLPEIPGYTATQGIENPVSTDSLDNYTYINNNGNSITDYQKYIGTGSLAGTWTGNWTYDGSNGAYLKTYGNTTYWYNDGTQTNEYPSVLQAFRISPFDSLYTISTNTPTFIPAVYQISNKSDWEDFVSNNITLLTGDIIELTGDIGTSGSPVTSWTTNSSTYQITIPSDVVFNGNGHYIHLNSSGSFKGLFILNGGTIKNVGVYAGSNITTYSDTSNSSDPIYCGYFASRFPYGIIENCFVNYVNLNTNTGGFIGQYRCSYSYGDLTFNNCYATCSNTTLTNNKSTGGFIGSQYPLAEEGYSTYYGVNFNKCYYIGKISQYAGGFLGNGVGYDGTNYYFTDCYVITSEIGSYGGGFIGYTAGLQMNQFINGAGMRDNYNDNDIDIKFLRCYVARDGVYAFMNSNAGGFIGANFARLNKATSNANSGINCKYTVIFEKCWCNLYTVNGTCGGFIGNTTLLCYSDEPSTQLQNIHNYMYLTFQECYYIGGSNSNSYYCSAFLSNLYNVRPYITFQDCYTTKDVNIGTNENIYFVYSLTENTNVLTNKININNSYCTNKFIFNSTDFTISGGSYNNANALTNITGQIDSNWDETAWNYTSTADTYNSTPISTYPYIQDFRETDTWTNTNSIELDGDTQQTLVYENTTPLSLTSFTSSPWDSTTYTTSDSLATFDAAAGGGGDPHIFPFIGKKYPLPSEETTFLWFDNNDSSDRVIMKIYCSKLEQSYIDRIMEKLIRNNSTKIQAYQDIFNNGTFFKYFKIEYANWDLIIDMGDLNIKTFTNDEDLINHTLPDNDHYTLYSPEIGISKICAPAKGLFRYGEYYKTPKTIERTITINLLDGNKIRVVVTKDRTNLTYRNSIRMYFEEPIDYKKCSGCVVKRHDIQEVDF